MIGSDSLLLELILKPRCCSQKLLIKIDFDLRMNDRRVYEGSSGQKKKIDSATSSNFILQ